MPTEKKNCMGVPAEAVDPLLTHPLPRVVEELPSRIASQRPRWQTCCKHKKRKDDRRSASRLENRSRGCENKHRRLRRLGESLNMFSRCCVCVFQVLAALSLPVTARDIAGLMRRFSTRSSDEEGADFLYPRLLRSVTGESGGSPKSGVLIRLRSPYQLPLGTGERTRVEKKNGDYRVGPTKQSDFAAFVNMHIAWYGLIVLRVHLPFSGV